MSTKHEYKLVQVRKVKCQRLLFIGVRAGGARGAAAPPPKILGNSGFFGREEKFGQSQFLKIFSSFSFLIHRYFLFLSEVGIDKALKFTRDSGCLTRDEVLVISKGDYKLIYIFLFFCVFFEHCTVLHCTSWCCKLIRMNFGITF